MNRKGDSQGAPHGACEERRVGEGKSHSTAFLEGQRYTFAHDFAYNPVALRKVGKSSYIGR